VTLYRIAIFRKVLCCHELWRRLMTRCWTLQKSSILRHATDTLMPKEFLMESVRSRVIQGLLICCTVFTGLFHATELAAEEPVRTLKIGIIGLDTSHATAFTKLLNDEQAAPDLAKSRVVAAYPKGSPDIESSTKRVPAYTKEVQAIGVDRRLGQ
jgi:hypothetical protein